MVRIFLHVLKQHYNIIQRVIRFKNENPDFLHDTFVFQIYYVKIE